MSSNLIGEVGEMKVMAFLEEHGFQHVLVFQNASGHGLDVIGLKKYRDGNGDLKRIIVSLEVKTTSTKGAGPRVSEAQKNMLLYTGTALAEAATATRRFRSISRNLRKSAQVLIKAIGSGVPVYTALVRVQLGGVAAETETHAKRVRVHVYQPERQAPSRKPTFDTRLKRR